MRESRLLLVTSALIVGWAGGSWRAGRSAGGEAGKAQETFHTGPTLEQVQALSSLVTARVDVADVTETRADGVTGGVKVALLVKGDFLLGTDLSRAKFESVDQAARTAVLVLPQPRVTSPRLDQDRTRLFAVTESGLWQLTPGDGRSSAAVINRAYRDAQHFVADACDDPTLLERARRQAEAVLTAFFRSTGWGVAVRWVD